MNGIAGKNNVLDTKLVVKTLKQLGFAKGSVKILTEEEVREINNFLDKYDKEKCIDT